MDGLSADWDQVGCSDLHEKTKAELYAKHFRQSLIQAHNDRLAHNEYARQQQKTNKNKTDSKITAIRMNQC